MPDIPRDRLSISLRVTATIAVIVALVSLTTLTIVASVKDVDTLSTVALALAIIAFVAQLMVFVVQTQAANAQELRSQQLYANMLGLLSQIREKTEGTQTTLTKMNSQMLEHIMGKARSETEAAGVKPGTPAFASALAENVVRLWPQARPVHTPSMGFATHVESPEDFEIARQLTTFPKEVSALRHALDQLQQLPVEDQYSLASLGEDEVSSRRPNAAYAPGLSAVHSQELENRGLIRPSPYTAREGVWVLTEPGRELARILSATDNAPAFADEVDQLRVAVDDYGRGNV